MAEQNNLKMYVWEHVLTEYTDGLMVALAHSVEEARSLLKDKIMASWGLEECEFVEFRAYGDLLKEPDVYETPKAVFVNGGA
jgi:hypothetical protein